MYGSACVCNARLAEGGWGVSGCLGHWEWAGQHKGKGKSSGMAVLRYAALLIGTTLS